MAQRRVYRASEMTALLQKQGLSPHAFEAIMDSSTSDGSRSMLNFEGAFGNVMNQQYYRPIGAEETGDDNDFDACLHQPEKKRRLTADKVQFLEKSFMLENKLEPERKMQLANDLGLQPRQVAIWFQNRRARWKTKQLEKDYEALKSGYNVLKMNCENLQKDNEKLKAEVILLADLLKEKGKSMTEPSQFKKLQNHLVTEAKESERQVLEVKQEELSSTNGAIIEFQSPHCAGRGQNLVLEPADSSNAIEHDHSDLSHAGEDEEVKGYHQFLKLEDNSDSFAFPVEDQAFWFWPY